MRDPRALLVLFICLIFPAATLPAQTQQPTPAPVPSTTSAAPPASAPSAIATAADPQTPAEFFARARQLSDLEASGIPFHLKATFVASGDAEFTGDGTYEEWWKDKENWRKEATLGNFRYVAFQNGRDKQIFTSSSYVPLRLRQALDAVLIRVPADAATSGDWKMQNKKISGVKLVALSSEYQCSKPTKYIRNPSKCVRLDYFAPAGVLRMQVQDGTTAVYNAFQPFGNLIIPRTIGAADAEGAGTLTVSITLLEMLHADEEITSALTAVPSGVPLAERTLASGQVEHHGTQKSHLTRQVQPYYPEAAKERGIQGAVVIAATIDDQGEVREPYAVHSAGPLLDEAAFKAVRQWRYQPLILDGKPVAVQTTISVVFALNR